MNSLLFKQVQKLFVDKLYARTQALVVFLLAVQGTLKIIKDQQDFFELFA